MKVEVDFKVLCRLQKPVKQNDFYFYWHLLFREELLTFKETYRFFIVGKKGSLDD